MNDRVRWVHSSGLYGSRYACILCSLSEHMIGQLQELAPYTFSSAVFLFSMETARERVGNNPELLVVWRQVYT